MRFLNAIVISTSYWLKPYMFCRTVIVCFTVVEWYAYYTIHKSLLRQPGDIWAPTYHHIILKDWSRKICVDSRADRMHFPRQRQNYLEMYWYYIHTIQYISHSVHHFPFLSLVHWCKTHAKEMPDILVCKWVDECTNFTENGVFVTAWKV